MMCTGGYVDVERLSPPIMAIYLELGVWISKATNGEPIGGEEETKHVGRLGLVHIHKRDGQFGQGGSWI